MKSLLPLCATCKHYQGVEAGIGLKCIAYPESIPVEILANAVSHLEPYKGDHGIQYKPGLALDMQKISKESVDYSLGKPSSHCGICAHFEKPHECEVVEGVISPAYWCKRFLVSQTAEDDMSAIATDPPVSEAQRRAMFAAKAGHSTLGIPKSVGEEFANADPGGKLPAKAKDGGKALDMIKAEFRELGKLFTKFLGEEAEEPKHKDALDEEADKPESKEQAEKEDDPVGRAASIAFVTQDGRMLFVKRAYDEENFPKHWSLPGGKLDDKESPVEGACREAREELGDCAFDGIREMKKGRTEHGWDHTTFAVPVKDSFPVKLNKEHSDWVWAYVDKPPQPIHPGVRHLLQSALEGDPDAGDVPEEGLGEDEVRHDPKTGQFTSTGTHEHLNHTAKDELPHGELSKSTREDIGTSGSAKREDMPEDVFLGPHRTYPVKEKRDGKWEYTSKLLEAAEKRAVSQGRRDIASKARRLRAEKFGSDKVRKALDEQPRDQQGRFASAGAHTEQSKYHQNKEQAHRNAIHESDRSGKIHHNRAATAHRTAATSHNQAALQYGKSAYKDLANWAKADTDKAHALSKKTNLAQDATQLHETEGAKSYRTGEEGADGFLDHSMAKTVERNQPGYGNGGKGHPVKKEWATAVGGGAYDSHEVHYLAIDRASSRSFDSNGNMHVAESNISKATVNPYFGREINAAMKGKPGWVELDPDHKYMLLRHPDELKKAEGTFNNLPILNKHVPISASKFDPNNIIGSLGDKAQFEHPYLRNSLAFWRKPAIDAIEDDARKQLSAAYSYEADMTPGNFEGKAYDGIMRNIKGNHVALVAEGRAGPDVVVGDEKPKELKMAKGSVKTMSRALRRMIAMDASPEELEELIDAFEDAESEDEMEPSSGGPMGEEDMSEDAKHIMDALKRGGADDKRRKMVMDAMRGRRADDETLGEKEGDLEDAEDEDMDDEEEAEDRKRRAEDARKKLGRDETPDERDCRERAEDARHRLGRDESEEEKEEREGKEAEDRKRRAEDARARLGRDESPEEMHERCDGERAEDRRMHRAEDRKRRAEDRKRAEDSRRRKADDRKPRRAEDRKRATDEPPPFNGRPNPGGKMDAITKPAMDQAIARAHKSARLTERATREAIRHCQAWTGALPAMDEAETPDEVYKTALTALGVNTKGLHPTAYRAVLDAQPRAGQRREVGHTPRVAQDEAAIEGVKSFNDLFGTKSISVAR